MNPALQKILEETAGRRGVDVSGIGQWLPMPQSPSSLPEVGSVPADLSWGLPIDMSMNNTLDIPAWDILEETTVVSWEWIPTVTVDETFIKIADDIAVMSPVELIDLIQRILVTQVQ